MKKLFLIMGILVCMPVFGTKGIYAQTVVLDTAINNVGDDFSNNLTKNSKIAILAIRSGSVRLSNYIIEELTSVLVNRRQVTVVDRAQLDLIQKEITFQLSGEVSDSSVQAIGKKLGAQYIVSGSFEPVGDYYRFRVRAIEVETAAIVLTYSANVRNDQVVSSLMSGREVNPPVSISKPAPEAPPQRDYGDFSAGQRWGTWALNAFVLPGIGSYVIMRDTRGGTTQLVIGLISQVLFIGGYIDLLTIEDSNYAGSNGNYTSAQEGQAIACIAIGGILAMINNIYNIVRSSTYHKPQSGIASLFDPTALNVALFPARDGSVDKVRLSYTIHF